LWTRVEHDGAAFWFGAADSELLEVGAACGVLAARTGKTTFEAHEVPADVAEVFCRFFVAAVRKWEGVTDGDGNEVACTREAVREFPTEAKIEVVAAYFAAREALDQRKGSPE